MREINMQILFQRGSQRSSLLEASSRDETKEIQQQGKIKDNCNHSRGFGIRFK